MITLIRRVLAAAFVIPLLALAACGDAGPAAATVNGKDILQDDFEAELRAILENDEYVKLIEEAQVQVKGNDGQGTLDNAFVAQVLTRSIAFELIRQEIDERDIEVTDDDLSDARQNVSQQVGGDEVFGAFSESYQDLLVERTAQVAVLQAALAGATTDAEAFYDENEELFEQACAHHILAETEEAANDVIARLEGGASFEEIASNESVDTGSGAQGGDLGCAPRDVYVPEFEEAIFEGPVGEIVGPVETQFGFHVIRVDERTVPPFEEVQAEVEQRVAQHGQQAFNEFISEALADAEVEVSPRYGTWSTDVQPGVVPPDVPTTVASGGDGGVDDLIEPPSVGG